MGRGYTNLGPHHRKIVIQLSYIHTGGQLHWNGHKKLLSQHTDGPPKFMKVKLDIIPEDIIAKYNLWEKQHNSWVYVRIELGMYGLPQAGILANKLLIQ